MAIGMTYDQYWFGDPLMVRAFYKADKLRRRREDENAWLYGMYVQSAIDATVGNMFRKTGETRAEYPKEPILLSKAKEVQEMREAQRKENEKNFALAWMTSFVQAGKNWGKNKGKER